MDTENTEDTEKRLSRAERMKAIVADSSLANGDMLGALQILNKDLSSAAKLMSKDEIRYFVDSYYDIQDIRIATANRVDELAYPKLGRSAERPSDFMVWFFKNLEILEHQIWLMLDKWSAAQDMGKWARAICGIGPVFSSGLLANIDIRKAPTVGHIWAFAGLDPTKKWEKGQKRPWNASLKRLCWLMGESFVKVQGNDKDIYGKLYKERKAYEAAKNKNHEYREECHRRIVEDNGRPKNRKMDPELLALLKTYTLPDKALHERSKRWAVKMFLSDWHAAAYRLHYNQEPPLPYPIVHLGHVHLRN